MRATPPGPTPAAHPPPSPAALVRFEGRLNLPSNRLGYRNDDGPADPPSAIEAWSSYRRAIVEAEEGAREAEAKAREAAVRAKKREELKSAPKAQRDALPFTFHSIEYIIGPVLVVRLRCFAARCGSLLLTARRRERVSERASLARVLTRWER